MYKAFDEFLVIPTWYTRHTEDERRFFIALNGVVNKRNFNPDALGEYMDQKRKNDPTFARLTKKAYEEARRHYVSAAWAVKRYLQAT